MLNLDERRSFRPIDRGCLVHESRFFDLAGLVSLLLSAPIVGLNGLAAEALEFGESNLGRSYNSGDCFAAAACLRDPLPLTDPGLEVRGLALPDKGEALLSFGGGPLRGRR